MTDFAIEARMIAQTYGRGVECVQALRPLDFDLERGEFLVVAGPSGSGKSTLLAIISGLLTPTEGRVSVLGRDLQGMSRDAFDRFRLEHFGFVFQGFHLLPALTALEQVSIVLERQGLRRQVAATRARERSNESAWARASAIARRNCQAAKSSASPSPGRSPNSRS
jgi:putative ABC transport system ATP-binding protein